MLKCVKLATFLLFLFYRRTLLLQLLTVSTSFKFPYHLDPEIYKGVYPATLQANWIERQTVRSGNFF